MSHTRPTFLSIVVATMVFAVPFSGVAAPASPPPLAAGSGSPEAVESLQTLSHEAARETPTSRRPIALDGATVYAESADQVALVAWALGRFERAGLELPPFELWYFADYAGCADPDDPSKQRAGYMAYGADSYTIFICGVEFTLLHELAHVWDVANLTDAERNRFLTERDLDEWSGVEWSQAGGEHLADVLAWGLQNGNVRPSRTKPNDDTSLRKAFELATGTAPLR